MKRYTKILFGILIASIASIAFTSCEDLLEVDPEEVLLKENYLGDDKIEARSALFGVLSQMQKVTSQYIVLGELRGDLMDVATGAEDELRQINMHNVSAGNIYTDPTNLFSIINNCNFALQRLDTIAYEKELLLNYASMLRIRTWAQMQILINYGKLPYIDKPIESIEDLEKEFPVLLLDQALDKLIDNLLPYQLVPNVSEYDNSLGFNIFSMIPNTDILLADLYLWKKNYAMAASHYKAFLDFNVQKGGALYNLTSAYGVTYTGSGGNYTLKSNNWGNIFKENIPGNESMMYIGYSKEYRQPNTAYNKLISQVRPSASALLDWSLQYKFYEKTAFEQGDNRTAASYIGQGDAARIAKYQHDYFMYYRVALVYLRYAEAINAAGYPAHALAVINSGVLDDAITKGAPRFTGNSEPFLNFVQSKYVITNSSGQQTGGNLGIRGRVGMAPLDIVPMMETQQINGVDTLINVTTLADSIGQVGLLILDEAGLETAFEGNRFGDLVRTSLRTNDAGIIAKAVASKFSNAGDLGAATTIEQKLMDKENWYLPLAIPKNFIVPDAEE